MRSEPGSDPLNEWFSPRRFILLVVCLLVACFLPVVVGREVFFFRDFAIFSYPLAAYHRACFWQGELPLWNPYNDCGLPFLAQWNTMVLYPLSLIYLLLPLPWSLSFFCLAHLALAAVGMFYLARAWSGHNFGGAVAGLGYAFGGVLLSCLKWPNNIAALGWMPWLVLAADRAMMGGGRRMGIAALIGAFQMLAGAPEVILLTWVLVGVNALARLVFERPRSFLILIRLVVLVLLVAGLSAAQLLPFLDLLRDSQRGARFAFSEWPMPIWGWANFLVPLFKTFPSYHGVHAQPGQYWISTYYVSLPLVLGAIYGMCRTRDRRWWVLGGLTLLVMWMALGDQALLYRWAIEHVPGFAMMRFPIKFVVLAGFLLPLLGGLGISQALKDSAVKRSLGAWTAVLLLGMGGIAIYSARHRFMNLDRSIVTWNAFWRGLWLCFGVGALNALSRVAPARRYLAGGALALVVVVDGVTHAPWQNPSAPSWVYGGAAPELEPKPELGVSRAMISPEAAERVNHLKIDDPASDVMASRTALYCNLNLLEAIPKVDGFYALYPRRISDVMDGLYRGTNRPPTGLMDFLGVTWISKPGSWREWERREALPMIQAPARILSDTNSLGRIFSPVYEPRKAAYMEEAPAGTINEEVSIESVKVSGGEISFAYRAVSEAMLVIAQTFNRNWRAELDGQPIEVRPANHAFMAVGGSAGQHRVTLKYASAGFRTGSVISGAFALGVSLLIVLGTKRR